MTKKFNRTLITAALPYANGPVHIGHIAGVYLPADIYARYKRLRGEDVLFVSGSDEHGVPITIRAAKEKISPAEVVEKYHQKNIESFEGLGIAFDIYSRTSAAIHHQTAQEFFTHMHQKGVFEENESEQYYDEEAETFLADRYIKGTCPHCGFDRAYGDQCENCGTDLSPGELVTPRSTLTGNLPKLKQTKHWHLPLNKYQDWLSEWILQGHQNWKANVYGQCKSWIGQGLQSRAVTRDLDWGVPVPLEEAGKKVLYVWFDAPIGYVSATKELAQKRGFDWQKYWKQDDTRLIHFIGKDNIVFHCIIFPVMLREMDDYILPENVPANEFLNLEGEKLSTSRDWAVWLHEYLDDFPGKQDVLRYVLCANMPENKDNDFTWADFQARNNNELVAVLGNFVNRALVLLHKYFNGIVPQAGTFYDPDKELTDAIAKAPEGIANNLEQFRFRDALNNLMDLGRAGNKYLTDTEPWKLIKTDPNRVATIMNMCLQTVANIQVLMQPFLPFSADSLGIMINQGSTDWNNAGTTTLLNPGHSIEKANHLFEKIEDKQIKIQIEKLETIREANKDFSALVKPIKQNKVTFNDFNALDLRIGTILEAEAIPKTSKLLKLRVSTTVDVRTIVSGIAKFYKPKQLINKQVLLIANLPPREIKGVVSDGMLLTAIDPNGATVVLCPDGKVLDGSIIA